MIKREVDLSEWQKLSDDWEQSGLNQKEYCKGKGVSRSTFSQSRTKLMLKGLAKPYYKRSKPVVNREALRFVPVNLPAENSPPQRLGPVSCETNFIEINLPHGIVMRIPT
ncbi:MAG: hypothetical protein NTV32_04350 [Gammaproteobacteria bacterium]|jgi:hypothetical protein|nr:hypothetical protein [Gammaproteobacteria bacterium]